ncbi:hypothetical protein CPT_Moby_097 [Stenotrophomonas phage Moby]|uniref:Uncharacterized protein n=1 Tax=Stenotrophomonas phage Moby TaxID=2601680 RepID=A0A5P8PMG7_9CAUD|nr:hypothetical protein HWC58_gp097 [Stenotrophomonas phage Moby]QFR57845.1 hypothetical protein CPT_Moby_097 [Stenotrophomonas phage Moby]
MTHLDWLKKQEYVLVVPQEGDVADADTIVWSRESKYGAPKCLDNGKIHVQVSQFNGEDAPTFTMSVHGRTKNQFSTSIAAYDISEDTLTKRGQAIEHRLVAAWMELAS